VSKPRAKRKGDAPARAMPRATERRQALRADLIDAAEKAIAANGLVGLNARDIAQAVGCSLGAIYNVFPHLDAIVFEVNSRTLAMFEAFVVRRGVASWKGSGGEAAVAGLIGLAEAYLDFAISNQPRWRALFEHRVSASVELPASYLADQARLFTLVEKPLAALRPDLDDRRRMLFARTMFSAVHGIVSLSLDAKLVSLPVKVLGDQLRTFVLVIGEGLRAGNGTLGQGSPAKRSRRA
jgi:AcrR family transcriptional regulator